MKLRNLFIGRRTVVFRLAGRTDWRGHVEIVEGRTATLEGRLSSSPSVDVRCKPRGAGVYVDDRRVGSSPMVVRDLSVGEHRVACLKTGYFGFARKVSLAPGETKVVVGRLEQESVLEVSCGEGAEVRLEGRAVGRSPTELRVRAGSYRIECVERSGLRYAVSDTVIAGQRLALAGKLGVARRAASGEWEAKTAKRMVRIEQALRKSHEDSTFWRKVRAKGMWSNIGFAWELGGTVVDGEFDIDTQLHAGLGYGFLTVSGFFGYQGFGNSRNSGYTIRGWNFGAELGLRAFLAPTVTIGVVGQLGGASVGEGSSDGDPSSGDGESTGWSRVGDSELVFYSAGLLRLNIGLSGGGKGYFGLGAYGGIKMVSPSRFTDGWCLGAMFGLAIMWYGTT